MCDAKEQAIYLGLFIVYAVVEYWLGKTSKVRAASLPELLLTAGVMFAVLVMRGKYGSERHEKPDGNGGSDPHGG
jgi:hypothetical protein